MRPIIFAIVLAAAVGCMADPPPVNSYSLGSIEKILENPRTHHGKIVRVRGYAVARFEAYFICSEPEAMERRGATKECLAISGGQIEGKDFRIEDIDGRVVDAVGFFYSDRFGHMGAYGGALSVVAAEILGSHSMSDVPPPPAPPRAAASSPN